MPPATAFDEKFALDLIATSALDERPGAARSSRGLGVSPVAEPASFPEVDFQSARAQALMVGADVVSFSSGVESDFRQAIADSALFAQLATNAKTPLGGDPIAWFDGYFSTLANLGWIVQARDTAEYVYRGDGFEVQQAIIGVITAFLQPISGAAQAVVTVLQGLREMDKDSPFITLFNRETQRGKIARFQFTYVHKDPQRGLMAEAMAFGLNAKKNVTQVLFFRLKKSESTLRRSTGSLSIDTKAMLKLQPALAERLDALRQRFVADTLLASIGG